MLGSIHPEVVLFAAGAAALYARALRHIPATRRQAASFVAALVAVLVALNGPLHDLSDWYLFSAHMVQHLVLTLGVPPLLLAGLPPAMADALLRPLLARRIPAAVARTLTRPLPAFALYATGLIGWHFPAPYNAALEMHGWHIVEHVVLMVTATIGWWPVLSPSRALPPLPHAAQLLYLFVFGMPMTVVAAMIASADHVLYPFYEAAPRIVDLSPLADQRLGGLIMWVPSGLIPLTAFTVVFFRWVASEADEPA